MKQFLLIAINCVLFGITSCDSPEKSAETKALPIKPAFDIPAVLGKNIDQVRTAFGKPTDKEIEPNKLQTSKEVDEWDNQFVHDSTTVLVTFNPKTRQVTDFFISAGRGSVEDIRPLLTSCHLEETSPNYEAGAVRALANPSIFTGVKVTKK